MGDAIWVVKHYLRRKPRETMEWEERTVESTHVTEGGAIQAAKNILASIPYDNGDREDFNRMCTTKTLSIAVVRRVINDLTTESIYEAKE